MRRVFAIDVESCPRCGKEGLQQIAVLTDGGVIGNMLAAMARLKLPP